MGRLLVQCGAPAVATPDGLVLVHLAEQLVLLEHDALNRLGVADGRGAPVSIPVAVNHGSLETWFVNAAALFASRSNATLDLQSEDQDHTAALLCNGTVLGAVTTLAEPVQGCCIHPLGSMRYVATCSPAFHAAHFAQGVNAQSLAGAPVLVFNRKDTLQSRFVQKISDQVPWRSPVWWLPSSRAFIQATLLGLGWTMNLLPLVQAELEAGNLVLLRSKAWEDVPLYWQHWRVNSEAMQVLTDSVLAAARSLMRRR